MENGGLAIRRAWDAREHSEIIAEGFEILRGKLTTWAAK